MDWFGRGPRRLRGLLEFLAAQGGTCALFLFDHFLRWRPCRFADGALKVALDFFPFGATDAASGMSGSRRSGFSGRSGARRNRGRVRHLDTSLTTRPRLGPMAPGRPGDIPCQDVPVADSTAWIHGRRCCDMAPGRRGTVREMVLVYMTRVRLSYEEEACARVKLRPVLGICWRAEIGKIRTMGNLIEYLSNHDCRAATWVYPAVGAVPARSSHGNGAYGGWSCTELAVDSRLYNV